MSAEILAPGAVLLAALFAGPAIDAAAERSRARRRARARARSRAAAASPPAWPNPPRN